MGRWLPLLVAASAAGFGYQAVMLVAEWLGIPTTYRPRRWRS